MQCSNSFYYYLMTLYVYNERRHWKISVVWVENRKSGLTCQPSVNLDEIAINVDCVEQWVDKMLPKSLVGTAHTAERNVALRKFQLSNPLARGPSGIKNRKFLIKDLY
jgi:hypothetical protein